MGGFRRALTKTNNYKKQGNQNPNFARKPRKFDKPFDKKKDFGTDEKKPRFGERKEAKPKQEPL